MDYKTKLEKFVGQDKRNRNVYIEQTNAILMARFKNLTEKDYPSQKKKVISAEHANKQIDIAISYYAPVGVNFKNVTVLSNRVDLDVNGLIELYGMAGYKLTANFVMPNDDCIINEAGFTTSSPVERHIRGNDEIDPDTLLDKFSHVYAYAYDTKIKMFSEVIVMYKKEIVTKIKSKSQGGVWGDFANEMIKKSAIRRLTKHLIIEDDLIAGAVEFSNEEWDKTTAVAEKQGTEDTVIEEIKDKIKNITEDKLIDLGVQLNGAYKSYPKILEKVVPCFIEKIENDFSEWDKKDTMIVRLNNLIGK